ncbi:MAG: glycosyltransferase [Synechococcaceae cyanobacterium]
MAEAQAEAEAPRRLVIAYRSDGFVQMGGLRRIAQELVAHLGATRPDLAVATLTTTPAGALPLTEPCRRLSPPDQLLLVGCDVPWAYGLAVRARLRGQPVSWLPSFHDPASAIHRRKARVAQLALQALQALGVVVYVQTSHERRLLQGRPPGRCRLSGHGLPAAIRHALNAGGGADPGGEEALDRPIDLLFLGRPTVQKGWPRFLAVARATRLRCEAIVPIPPQGEAPVALHHRPDDAQVKALLLQAKLVLIPATYESFGIAQLEALMAGCVVPVLGHWPLWDGCEVLQWQGLDPAGLAQRCELLCGDPRRRRRLLQRQLRYLRQHPVLTTPVLPGLP